MNSNAFAAAILLTALLGACSADGPARTEPDAEAAAAAAVPAGRYGCTASRFVSGAIEYDMKGSIEIAADGGYRYLGFEQPSEGRVVLGEGGVLRFSGGHLDGGEATPVEDRPGKYFVVAPAISENRWTCGTGE